MMDSLVLSDVGFPDGSRGELCIGGGRIVAAPPPGARRVDGSAHVALPRLVDAHVHLDKTLLGSRWYPHRAVRSLLERVDGEIALLAGPDVEPVAVRAGRLIDLLVANGTTRIQSHVDVGPGSGLDRLHGVLAAVESARAIADVDVVAFPQEGVLRAPGTIGLLRQALELGADAIGGLDPAAVDGDRARQLDVVFGLACEFAVRVDVHLHEPGAIGAETLRAIVARTTSHGLGGRVAVSHAYCLCDLPRTEVRALASSLAQAGVTLVSAVPGRGMVMPYDVLADAGLDVVLASDNIRDAWSPLGTGDVLERIALAAHQQAWYGDRQLRAALDAVTTAPARMLGEDAPALRVGDRADLTLVPAVSVGAAVLGRPADRVVFRGGQVVAAGGRTVRQGDLAWPPDA
jgi:cytosine/creatinine deaminase